MLRGRVRAVEVRLAVLAVIAALLAASPRGVAGQEPIKLTLGEAVVQALGGSEVVQVAEAGLLRARGDRFSARSGYLPKVNGTLGYTRTLASEFSALRDMPADSGAENPFAGLKLPFGQENRYDFGLSASQTVFAGGQIVARNRVADAGLRSAEIEVNNTRAALELDVTQAYWDAVVSDRLVAIAESVLAQAEATYAQVSAAEDVGETSEFEALRAQVARDNARPAVIQRKASRDIAHMRLKQLLNVSLDATLELVTPLPVKSNTIVRAKGDAVADVIDVRVDTTTERGQVRQAAALVEMREQLARATLAQRLPSVALVTQWNRLGYPVGGVPEWNDMRSNWTVGVQLQVPLVTGGAQRGAELRAQADVVEARARLEQTRELAVLDAKSAIERLESARAAWDASAGTVEQADRAYRIAEIRFREGLSTQVELSDARLMLQQAEVNRALAARDLEIAKTVIRLLPDLPLNR